MAWALLSFEVALSPAWGRSRISGPGDLSARAWVSSNGNSLHLKLRVKDDKLVIGDDLNSDHVELWFALPWVAETPVPNFYICEDSALFWKGEGDGAPEGLELMPSKVFLGMVHIALYPDSRPVVLMDKDFYEFLKPLGINLSNPAKFVRYRAKTTSEGYEIEADISPEALLWVTSERLDSLLWLCDVIDVDSKKQESLFSSSPKRKWADPRTFSLLRLNPPLAVEGIEPVAAKVLPVLAGSRSGWFFSPKGWQPFFVEAEEMFFAGGEWRDQGEGLERVDIESGYPKLHRRGDLLTAQLAGVFGFWLKGKLVGTVPAKDARAWPVTFANGEEGVFALTQEGSHMSPIGHCGASYSAGAHLYEKVGGEFKEILEVFLNDCLPAVELEPPPPDSLLDPQRLPRPFYESPSVPWPPKEWKELDPDSSTFWLEAYRFLRDTKGRLRGVKIRIIGEDREIRLSYTFGDSGAKLEEGKVIKR